MPVLLDRHLNTLQAARASFVFITRSGHASAFDNFYRFDKWPERPHVELAKWVGGVAINVGCSFP